MMVAESVTDRLCSNDPTFLKLHLVHEPAEYFSRQQEEQSDVDNDNDDSSSEKNSSSLMTFRAFLKALRRSTSITYVFLERRFVRHLSTAEYAAVLYAIGAMENVREVEIWSVHVPLSTLCAAFSRSSSQLHRLGLGMVTLTETHHCQGLAHHATLQTFYLSDFRFLENDNHEQGQEGGGPENLDSLLEALGTCPSLGMVEIVNHQNNNNNPPPENDNHNHNYWSSPPALAALASCTSLFHLTLRRLGLPLAHAIALAGAISEPPTSSTVVTPTTLLPAPSNDHDDDDGVPPPRDHKEDDDDEHDGRRSLRRRLRVLHVDENHLGNAGSIAIVQAIVNYRRQCRRQGIHGGGGGVKDLSLRNNQIDATGCVAIADALLQDQQEAVAAAADDDDDEEEMGVLEKLNLAMNPIEDRGGAALARLLQHSAPDQLRQNQNPNHYSLGLKQLELSRANMTDVGCCDLARAIRDNTSLLVLGLSFNRMKDATYIAFGASLKVNHTLQSINLQIDRRELTIAASAALLEMIAENYVLRDVCTMLAAGGVTNPHTSYANQIRLYLRLNHAGRKLLFEGKDKEGLDEASKADWIRAIQSVMDDLNGNLNAIFYLVKANPAICG